MAPPPLGRPSRASFATSAILHLPVHTLKDGGQWRGPPLACARAHKRLPESALGRRPCCGGRFHEAVRPDKRKQQMQGDGNGREDQHGQDREDKAAGSAPFAQSGVQRPQAQDGHLRDQSRPRLRDLVDRRRAEDRLAEHAGARQDFRGDGVRGVGADRALARLRRQDQFQRTGLRVLLLGRRHERLDALFRHLRDLACADHPSDHGRQAGGRDRPHQQRTFCTQYRYRLEPSRDRDVRLAADGARRPLRMRCGMARHHQAGMDLRGHLRLRRPLLPHQEGLPRAQADPETVSAGDECGRLGQRPALRRQVLRHGLCRVRHQRLRAVQGQGRRLPQPRARGIWPRDPGLELSLRGAGRDREGSARLFRRIRQPARRLGGGDQPGRHHDRQRQDPAERGAGRDEEALHRRLGRLPDHRHAGADRGWAHHHVEDRARRHAGQFPALHRRHALVPAAGLSARGTGGIAVGRSP